jgi:GDPmannose 4,6-dehydratase
MAVKKALITGITGQDGSFLAEQLLERGYQVHGLVRRVSMEDPTRRLWRIRHLLDRVQLHAGSLESYASIFQLVEKTAPDECYHLAAESYVSYSFDDELSTISTNILGTHFMLSALRERAPECRFYFAGSSEMFGSAAESPQNELTPFNPRSPYGISKIAGFHLVRNYREAYGLFACSGICYNHESERRGFEYVTRKISSAAARIKLGKASEIRLGNLQARRDWGYAPEYVSAMQTMLQQSQPGDYVIASGVTHSVQEFAETALGLLDLRWEDHVVTDESLFRPAEAHELRGDPSKARRELAWAPKVGFEQLVRIMVEADLQREQGESGP